MKDKCVKCGCDLPENWQAAECDSCDFAEFIRMHEEEPDRLEIVPTNDFGLSCTNCGKLGRLVDNCDCDYECELPL